MGLSSYGTPKYYDLDIGIILLMSKDDGSIHLNMKYFAFTYDKVMTNESISQIYSGILPRKQKMKRHYKFTMT